MVGVPDERLGEEICAWVQVKENQSVSEKEIKAYCKEKVKKKTIVVKSQFSRI